MSKDTAQFIAKKFQNLPQGLSLDQKTLEKYDDVINLSIGDTDFVTDQKIIQKAFQDAQNGYTHYGFPQGDPQLVTAIQKQWLEDYQIHLDLSEILISASSCLGMSLVLFAILNPDEEVLLLSPYFPPYKNQVELAGGKAVEIPLSSVNNYTFDKEDIIAKITPKTKAIIFNNPCNPTGKVFSKRDIQLLLEIAQTYNLLIISDEIYTDYVFDGEFIPVLSFPTAKEYCITLNSFSKNYLMTGWRIGAIIGPSAILNVMNKVNAALIYSSPSVSQRAAIEAIHIREQIRKQYIPIYGQRIAYLNEQLPTIPYLDYLPSEGTFYAFPNIERTGMSSAEFTAYLFEKTHILVSPGYLFGSSGEGHFRIACTVDRCLLEEAVVRMRRLSF